MENSGFQSQLLSVMEVLAKAAVAEIHRRVDDSCAVLRLEVSQSRRDIDQLQRKCEGMEAELRRTRRRARRRVFYPSVKVVLNPESSGWDAEAQRHAQQCADVEPANDAEHILIKEECADDSEDKLISGAEQPACFAVSQPVQTDAFVERYLAAESTAAPGCPASPADGYDVFPAPPADGRQSEAELTVKHEEDEPDENAAPPDSAHRFEAEDGDRPLWSADLCGDAVDPSFPCAEHQFEPIPFAFPSPSGSLPEDAPPQIHSAGKSLSATAARAKRRARALGCRRPQPDALANATDQRPIPQPPQLHCRDSPQARNPNEDAPAAPNPAASSFYGHGRSGGGGLARRMRTPWRSGIGEKRFSCTYCDKGFVRFSQLKEHLRSHTGEKPFSCLQCGRSFTKQCNLIRHAVVHSGEKPYECSLCGKCFTQRSSLKSHQKTAH